MSHFSDRGNEERTDRSRIEARASAPSTNFECTGVADEFVQDVDQTEERERSSPNTRSRGLKLAGWFTGFVFDDKGNWRHEYSQPDPNRGMGKR